MLKWDSLRRYAGHRLRYRIWGAGSSMATAAYFFAPNRTSEAHKHRLWIGHELQLMQKKCRVKAMQNRQQAETEKEEILEAIYADRRSEDKNS